MAALPSMNPDSVARAALDDRFMGEALALARAIAAPTWPNPPVGAVVVKNGRIVGRGAHTGPGSAHAEPRALDQAGDLARGATLYVTLEPCNHTGRTGPCAPAVLASGVTRVVVAMRDPNPGVGGGGCRSLRENGIDVAIGVRAEEALDLVWPFVCTDNFARPYLELKTAVSLDGRFAPPTAERREKRPVFLTGTEARTEVHRRRRWLDLVLVGEGTARADSPRLDGRLAPDGSCPGRDPQAGYVDTDLSWTGGLDRDRYLVFTAEESAASPHRAAIEKDGGQLVFCGTRDGRIDPGSVLARCGDLGLQAVMLEGGPTLAASFLVDNLVDRWIRQTSPVVLGAGIGWPAAEGTDPSRPFTLTRTLRRGEDLEAVYDRRDFHAMLAQVTV
jgi:diaminohydroxyphosphoribosylaminopyrimidine deaminase/5-amino-6-(5-phosphoribosylamino)uracil reductase